MESATALLIDPGLAMEHGRPMAEAAEPAAEKRRLPRVRLGRLVAVAVLMAAVGGLLYLGTWPPMATVMSASMSPTIKTGDVVILKHLEGPPRVGDVIAVSVPDQARARYGYPPVVVHRVVRISPSGDISTKGDARPRPDPFTVRRASVSSKVVATVPAAGHVLAFFTSTLGLVWLAGGVLLLVVLPLLERQRDAREREEETLAELRAELRTISEELAALRSQQPVVVVPREPEPLTVEMPAVAEMTEAVDEYLYSFEAEFSRVLDDVAREIESA
jgi:signal peptidase I